jgi:hypothetical protein
MVGLMGIERGKVALLIPRDSPNPAVKSIIFDCFVLLQQDNYNLNHL